jgi:uncharacterized membrane protein YfbV (UPF0208 family)
LTIWHIASSVKGLRRNLLDKRIISISAYCVLLISFAVLVWQDKHQKNKSPAIIMALVSLVVAVGESPS